MTGDYNPLQLEIRRPGFHRRSQFIEEGEGTMARPELEGEWVQGWPDRARARLMPSKDADGKTIYARTPLLDLEGLIDRKSTRLNSSHIQKSRMPSSA